MLEYLLSEYAKTKFPNFYIVHLKNIGVFDKEEATELYRSGKIRVEQGMNGKLIILNDCILK